jgi:glucokinase
VIVLAADIGGTHARLGLVEIDVGLPRVLAKDQYDSQTASGPEELVHRFLGAHPTPRPECASLAVAGHVVAGVVKLSNVDWQIDSHSLTRDLGLPVTLVNDFVAAGFAIPHTGPGDFAVLQGGSIPERAPIAAIGAGTGLGHVFLLWDGSSYRPYDSEAGHCDFGPAGALQEELLGYLAAQYGHVSWERVLSGPGLAEVYRFLAHRDGAREQRVVAAEVAAAGDPSPVIAAHALAGSDPLAVAALDLFVSAYGAQAGNFALAVGARGVFVVGGIAPRILAKLKDGTFVKAFRAKGRFAEFLSTVPVRVVTQPDLGLIGAGIAAAQQP